MPSQDEDKPQQPARRSRYNEAQLLRMMETAARSWTKTRSSSDAMKGRGLGTPATRADTIERLMRRRRYARRVEGKSRSDRQRRCA